MLNLILLSCGIILLILASIVLYSNFRAKSNRWLGVFLFSGLFWLLANVLANNATNNSMNLFFSRSALIGSSIAPLAYLMFCAYFTGQKFVEKGMYRMLLVVPVALLLLTTPTPLNVKQSTAESFEPGIAYALLLPILVIYYGASIIMLARNYAHSSHDRREQVRYILIGTALTIFPAIILSLILPVLGYTKAAEVSPALVSVISVFTTISIVRHKLFNIRFFVFRSIAYTLSLLVIGCILIVPVVYLVARFAFDIQPSIPSLIAASVVVTLAATSFNYLWQIFDSWSRKLFFRDSYEPGKVLGDINRSLVSTLDLQPMLNGSADILTDNLKSEFTTFMLNGDEPGKVRLVGKTSKKITVETTRKVQRAVNTLGDKVVITDYIDQAHYEIKDALNKLDIAAIVQLAPGDNLSASAGYMLLGYKKSGNPYNLQDVHTLKTTADVLYISIQNAIRFEEIQNFNITLQQRIDESTRKLRHTNAKLQALDETKDDFISMASHQLRTPLTTIKGYISMVLDGDAGKLTPLQHKMLDQAFVSSQRMVFLIADLLNISRLKTGKFVIESAKVSLANIVEDEVRQLKGTAAGRSLTLQYNKPVDFPELMLDETKIRQVIMNFIDNAIYYTPSGGNIDVQLIDRPDTVELRVADNGIGVPKSEQPHLFTKFYRAGNARRARPDGTGLGLFMARKVIMAQGGLVIFDSKEGKGSTFGFIFSKQKVGIKVEPRKVTVS